MSDVTLPVDEEKRLADLYRYEILDTPDEKSFDDLTYLAAAIVRVPVCLISLVDKHRLWFKSRYGLNVIELPREEAFCNHAICYKKPYIINDASTHPLYENSPLVQKEPKIRFYAAVPLMSTRGYNLGVLCVIDYVPREISLEQTNLLKILARQVTNLLETRFLSRQIIKYTDALEKTQHLQHEAFHDALTGLANRKLFIEKTNIALARSQELHCPLCALLFIDLNRFKSINDRWGHLAGDKLLIAVAYRLKTAVRSIDTVARLGGDEFVVLLEEIEILEETLQIVKRIIREIEKPFEIFSRQVSISASIGIVRGSCEYQNALDLIRDADLAMYRAKSTANDNYSIFDKSIEL